AQAWEWTFPGGSPASSTQQHPAVNYQNPGSYGVQQKIWCVAGGVDSVYIADFITVDDCSGGCNAAFTADPTEGCAPLQVQFTDQSTNAQSWEWTFPGGTPASSTQQHPAVTYNTPGVYWVKLKMTCVTGVVDSTYTLSYINVLDCGGELDFGDAPDSPESPVYPTLLANNGARHRILPNLYLGFAIDAEPDGQPSLLADDDDRNPPNAPDDEDGVTMSPFIAPGQAIPITIVASDTGVINAWLDFNIDGDWADAGEHFIAAQPVWPGANLFTLNVPAGAYIGLTYARFRLSTVRQLSYDGLAPDGEVEDYPIEITEPQEGSIIIIKEAVPEDNTQFWFIEQLNSGFFNILCWFLQDPLNNKLTILNPANRVQNVSEPAIPGWSLKNITITGDQDNGSTIDLVNRQVDVDLDPGENIVITFFNEKTGEDELPDLGDAPDGTNHSGVMM
ncbi:PKD domain-containing protein, partial [bacterium]|nr:PKD domain-containing protein [bacterium]